MQEAKREVHPADLPPRLEWEGVMWQLYERICTQWRIDAKGAAYALDYNPAIALMQAWELPIDLGLGMLRVIELAMIKKADQG